MSDELWPGKGVYTAIYTRERDGTWTAQIEGHENEIHAFGRSLSKARAMIREVLGLWYDDAEDATIEDRVLLGSVEFTELLERTLE